MRAPPRKPIHPRLRAGCDTPKPGSGPRALLALGWVLVLGAGLWPGRLAAYGSGPGETPLCAPQAWSRPTDAHLCRAAGALARALAGAPPEGRSPRAVGRQLSFQLESAGVADAQVQPFQLRGDHLGALLLGLDRLAEGATAGATIGVGLAPEGSGYLGVLLVSRRLLATQTLERQVQVGRDVRCLGRLPLSGREVAAWLGTPDGGATRLPVARQGRAVEARFRPEAPGRYVLEWVVDAGEGPEVAALAPVYAGVSPPDAPPPLPGLGVGAAFEAQARAQLARLRRTLGRPPLAPGGAALSAVAETATRDVARRGRVTHRPATGGTLTSRLGEGRVAWAWAGEALGSGPDPASALEAILASPVHRHTLADPRAQQVAMAVRQTGDTWWVALVLAAPLGDRAAAPGASARRVATGAVISQAASALARVRRSRGLPAPLRDPALDGLAQAHARRLADAGRSVEPAAEARLREAAFTTHPRIYSVRVETVVAGAPEAAAQAPGATTGACDRLGLGVARGTTAEGVRLWLTLVCAGLEGGP